MTSSAAARPLTVIRPERRGAVDQDEVEVVDDGVDGPLELQLPAEGGHQLDLDAGQVDGGRGHEEVLDAGRLDAVLERLVPHDHVVHRQLEVPGVDAQAGGGVALGIEIDDQDPVAQLGQRRSEVDGGGGLAHAALLVGDGDDPGQLPGGRLRAVEQFVGVVADGGRPHGAPRLLAGQASSPFCPPLFLAISASGSASSVEAGAESTPRSGPPGGPPEPPKSGSCSGVWGGSTPFSGGGGGSAATGLAGGGVGRDRHGAVGRCGAGAEPIGPAGRGARLESRGGRAAAATGEDPAGGHGGLGGGR